jgi:hypothetical protein
MRWLALVVVSFSSPALADPPPPDPRCSDPVRKHEPDAECWDDVGIAGVEHALDASYGVGVQGTTATGDGTVMIASVGADVGYTATLINDDSTPRYDISAGLGATLSRMTGTVDATGAATRAHVRLGPHPVPVTETRYNLAWFPLSFEIEHQGELSSMPKLSARPDESRALVGRERVSAATRFVRVEVAGDEEHLDKPPGDTEPMVRSSFAIDVMTLYGDVDATIQDGSRIEAGIGGAMMSMTSRYTMQGRFDFFGIEHRSSWLPDGTRTAVDTVWMMRLDVTNPHTGSVYGVGWGTAIGEPFDDLAVAEGDPEASLDVWYLGWWSEKRWGGFGGQFARKPYITMAGEPAIDNRFWLETWRAGKLGIVGRGFVARSDRYNEMTWLEDWTTGVEIDARREIKGIDVALRVEAARSFYAALDGGPLEPGFAARGSLTLTRAAAHRWQR